MLGCVVSTFLYKYMMMMIHISETFLNLIHVPWNSYNLFVCERMESVRGQYFNCRNEAEELIKATELRPHLPGYTRRRPIVNLLQME